MDDTRKRNRPAVVTAEFDFSKDKVPDDGFQWRKYGCRPSKNKCSFLPEHAPVYNVPVHCNYYRCKRSYQFRKNNGVTSDFCNAMKKVYRITSSASQGSAGTIKVVYINDHNHPPERDNQIEKDTIVSNSNSHNLSSRPKIGAYKRPKAIPLKEVLFQLSNPAGALMKCGDLNDCRIVSGPQQVDDSSPNFNNNMELDTERCQNIEQKCWESPTKSLVFRETLDIAHFLDVNRSKSHENTKECETEPRDETKKDARSKWLDFFFQLDKLNPPSPLDFIDSSEKFFEYASERSASPNIPLLNVFENSSNSPLQYSEVDDAVNKIINEEFDTDDLGYNYWN